MAVAARGSIPLTRSRSKPAVPVAGKYRLIDIPISNCINSGCTTIYVLTQFLSVSLHRHIANTYKFDMFSKGFVEVLAAQQTNESMDWYQGTADAVRQNIAYIERENPDEVLILSGDQLYRMDFRNLIETHRGHRADVTIAAIPVAEKDTRGVRPPEHGLAQPRDRLRREAEDAGGTAAVLYVGGVDRAARHPRSTAGTTSPTWASICSGPRSFTRC